MAKPALDGFARPTFHDKRLAFGEAPDWYIGCEGRSRVPAFEAEQIVGDLHDPLSDRLALAGLHRSPKQTRHIGLWRGVALDHLDAFARLQGRKVGGRAASDVISTRWASVKVFGITIRPPFGLRACAPMTASSSDLSRTGAVIASTAKDAAVALKGFSQYSKYVAVAGLNRKATLATRGAISLSSSSHLPAIAGSIVTKPVTFPPGRGKLATKPLPIGSATSAKTMGMLRVSCSIVAVIGVLCVRMRSANRCIKSASAGVAQRMPIRTSRPSVHPSL